MKSLPIIPKKKQNDLRKSIAILLILALGALIPDLANSQNNFQKNPLTATSSITEWDLVANVDLGGEFPVIAVATIETLASTFNAIVTTQTIGGAVEVYTIPFNGTFNNGIYAVSNLPFDAVEGEQTQIDDLTFTINGDNLTGDGTFSVIIPDYGSISGTVNITGTKTGEASYLTVSPSTLSLGAASGSQGTVDISSNIDWTVSGGEQWLSVSPTSGSNDGQLTFTVAGNIFPEARVAVITISGTGVEAQQVTVTQAAGGVMAFDYPAPRYGHTACKMGEYVYLYGGTNNKSILKSASDEAANYKLSTALYRYDSLTSGLVKLNPDLTTGSAAIPGMTGHNSIVLDNRVFILNGLRSDTTNDQPYFFDPVMYTWEQEDSELPNAIKRHAYIGLSDATPDSLFVAGGQNKDSLASDSCFLYNTITTNWSALETLMPYASHSGASLFYKNKLYIAGGLKVDGPTQQISFYDTKLEEWNIQDISLPVELFGMSYDTLNNNLFLYGGASSSNEGPGEDVLSEQFSTKLFQMTIDTLSGEIQLKERADGLPPLLYSAGWLEANDEDTLFYTFGGISAVSPDGDTILSNNFYRFDLPDSLIQQYDTLTQSWGALKNELRTFTDSLKFDAAPDAAQTVFVASNTGWKAECDQEWLDFDQDLQHGNRSVSITANENSLLTDREARLAITCDNDTLQIVVIVQSGATPTLSVSEVMLELTAESNSTATFDLSSNTQWEITCEQSWLSIDPNSGTNSASITVTAEENSSLEQREAILAVSAINSDAPSLAVTVTQAGATPYLTISNQTIAVTSDENTEEGFIISSNTDWSISVDQDWVTASELFGTGDASIALTIEKNENITERSASIEVSGTSVTTQTLTITQAAAPATLEVSANSLDIDPEEGSEASFNISSNASWTVVSDQGWLTLSPESGSGNDVITLVAEANSSGSTRKANVTVNAAGELTQTVEISQISLTGISTKYLDHLKVYPNPFSEAVFIDPNNQKITYTLYDLQGQSLQSGEISKTTLLKLPLQSNGIYFLEVVGPETVNRIKLIKR